LKITRKDCEFKDSLGYITSFEASLGSITRPYCRHKRKKKKSYKKKKGIKTKRKNCWVPVAHDCNPSFSGSRAQEDHGSKPTPGK
jgi:hypothetical protein